MYKNQKKHIDKLQLTTLNMLCMKEFYQDEEAIQQNKILAKYVSRKNPVPKMHQELL